MTRGYTGERKMNSNMKTRITVLMAGLGLLVLAGRAEAITLVRAGRAEAVIVVPTGSKAAGAADLQRYVEKVSGAKLERHRGPGAGPPGSDGLGVHEENARVAGGGSGRSRREEHRGRIPQDQGRDGQVLRQPERQLGGHGVARYPKLPEFDAGAEKITAL